MILHMEVLMLDYADVTMSYLAHVYRVAEHTFSIDVHFLIRPSMNERF